MRQGIASGNRTGLWIVALALLFAFALLGSRGTWDPDEGRYTNVAINMLESGDWLNPHRTSDVGHWTKPPLTYWAVAASVGAFGLSPWAARLPMAASYLLCVWLTWRLARRLAPGTQATAALAFATMLLPLGAAQLVTTDFVLAACETLAVWAFIESRHGPGPPGPWIALMWAAFALAFLTKGPPGLLPLPVLLWFDRRMPGRRSVFQLTGISLFVLLALPWYVAVMLNNPGLFAYFVGDEVVNRVTTNEFGRHGQWYGWASVYAPTLVLGTLPWTPTLWRWTKALPARLRRWRDPVARRSDAAMVFLTVWLLLPLLVFCLARSRMPLYLLPLFVPLALLIGVQRQAEGRSLPTRTQLASWVLLVLLLRLGTVVWPTQKDASTWADQIRARTSEPVREVIFVDDMARYGLRLHLDAEVEKVSLAPIPPGTQSRFNPVDDEDLLAELDEGGTGPGAIWVCKLASWPQVRAGIERQGYQADMLGTPFRHRVIFRITRPGERRRAALPQTSGQFRTSNLPSTS